jgi:hypothetical protein
VHVVRKLIGQKASRTAVVGETRCADDDQLGSAVQTLSVLAASRRRLSGLRPEFRSRWARKWLSLLEAGEGRRPVTRLIGEERAGGAGTCCLPHRPRCGPIRTGPSDCPAAARSSPARSRPLPSARACRPPSRPRQVDASTGAGGTRRAAPVAACTFAASGRPSSPRIGDDERRVPTVPSTTMSMIDSEGRRWQAVAGGACPSCACSRKRKAWSSWATLPQGSGWSHSATGVPLDIAVEGSDVRVSTRECRD